jgi:membrane protease YdiL (CAAX protease family)
MRKQLSLAENRPVAFALVVTVVLFALMTGAYVLGAVLSGAPYGDQIGQTLGMLVATACLAFVLWRFGWLTTSGLAGLGSGRAWLAVLVPIVYGIAATLYAYSGGRGFSISDPALALLVALNAMASGMVEEVAYRGLVLHAFVRRWRDSRRGVLVGVMVSSLIFGASHMVWAAMGKPLHLAALQSLTACLSGIVYAALTLYSGSIWPAIVFHGLANAAVWVMILDRPDFAETVSMGLLDTLLSISLVVYGFVLLSKATTLPLSSQKSGFQSKNPISLHSTRSRP